MDRNIKLERKTKETEIVMELNIDGKGVSKINTSIPFFNHMLELFSLHGFFDIYIDAKGDTDIDFHHLIEDIGIVVGKGFGDAIGDKKGINRFGTSTVPMDESLTSVSIDVSGRPILVYNSGIEKGKIGNFDVELIKEFFKAFSIPTLTFLRLAPPLSRNLATEPSFFVFPILQIHSLKKFFLISLAFSLAIF